MKSKRILALTGAVILIALYISSIIFALMDSPLAENLLLASLFCWGMRGWMSRLKIYLR